MIRKIAAAAGAAALFFWTAGARALDGIAVEAGRGTDRTTLLRLGVTDRWRERALPRPQWRLAGYWEFSAGGWDGPLESAVDVAATPVFRLQRDRFYVEAAIGAHLVKMQTGAADTSTTTLQFGNHLGTGIRHGKWDFGLRVQHLSNGGLRSPNPGINFVLVRLQYDLE